MPKISLVLGRRTIQVYDFKQPTIRIGRSDEMDITIDNVSVSREHAHIFRTEKGWAVRDAGSSNGTFMEGQRLDEARPLQEGDEISIGKFSLFFDKLVGDAATPTQPTAQQPAPGEPKGADAAPGTMYIRPSDVQELLRSSAERRQAHLAWKAGGEEGEHILPEEGCVLVGRDDLCDLQVPKGPKHHLLVSREKGGYQVRNLSFWRKMKVDGRTARRARLSDGDVVRIAGLELKFVDALD